MKTIRMAHVACALVLLLTYIPFSLTEARALARSEPDSDYTSPTFGYTLSWNSADWQTLDESSQGGEDLLLLSNGVADVYIQSWTGYGGNAPVCLADIVMQISRLDGVTSSQYAGDKFSTGGSEYVAYSLYQITRVVDGKTYDLAWDMSCRTLVRGESVLVITWSAKVDSYGDQSGEVSNLLYGLVDRAVIDVRVEDADGNPLPGLCAHEALDKDRGGCDQYDGKYDGVFQYTGVVPGTFALETDGTPEGYDPHTGVSITVAPGEETTVVFRYLTGPAHPEVVPPNLCLNGVAPRLVAEVGDDDREPLLRVSLLSLSFNLDDRARIDQPPAGKRYVAAGVVLENIGDRRLKLAPDQFLLYDGDYVLTVALSGADRLLHDGSALAPVTLAPGEETEGTLLFQVAEAAARPLNLMYGPDANRLAPIVSFYWMNGEVNCNASDDNEGAHRGSGDAALLPGSHLH